MEWLAAIVVIAAVAGLALGLARGARGARRRPRELDPLERQRAEEEIRRRHGGSGPTVDGGQHLR